MHLSKAFSPSHLPKRFARQCCFLISIDIKEFQPGAIFHESPNKKGHIRFRLVKSTCAIGLKHRCVLFRFHPWWLPAFRRSTWLTEVTSKAVGSNMSSRSRWRKRWKVEVSFQTFAEDQLLGKCWVSVFWLPFSPAQSATKKLHFKEKEDQTKGGHGHPEVGNGPIRSYQLQKVLRPAEWMKVYQCISRHIREKYGNVFKSSSNHHKNWFLRLQKWVHCWNTCWTWPVGYPEEQRKWGKSEE